MLVGRQLFRKLGRQYQHLLISLFNYPNTNFILMLIGINILITVNVFMTYIYKHICFKELKYNNNDELIIVYTIMGYTI